MPRHRSTGSVFTSRVGKQKLGSAQAPEHRSAQIVNHEQVRNGHAQPSPDPICLVDQEVGRGTAPRKRRRKRMIRIACPMAMRDRDGQPRQSAFRS